MGGTRLLDAPTVAVAAVTQAERPDAVSMVPTACGRGYAVGPMSPPGRTRSGIPERAGSGAFADPDAGIGFIDART